MTTPKRLRNAPITEALIDIRVKLPTGVDVTELKSVHNLISNEYPHVRERIKWESKFEFKGGQVPKPTATETGPDGYLYTSEDNKQVVQI